MSSNRFGAKLRQSCIPAYFSSEGDPCIKWGLPFLLVPHSAACCRNLMAADHPPGGSPWYSWRAAGTESRVFFLEFYHHPQQGDENRVRLSIQKLHLGTVDEAKSYARGALENLVFDGRIAHSCRIRASTGTLLLELKRESIKNSRFN